MKQKIVSSPRIRRALRSRLGNNKNSTRSNQLSTTIITVLLTFFLTTVGGSLISFWIKINEKDTEAAYVEMQNALTAYEHYVANINPVYEAAQEIGIDLIGELAMTKTSSLSGLVTARMSDFPSLTDVNGNGAIMLYLGKDAEIGINAVTGQFLAMKVMIERRSRSGQTISVNSHDASKYLTGLRVSYSYYLLGIVKCKQNVAKSFMLFGKMEAMRACESPDERTLKKFDLKFWGPGIFTE